MNTPSFTAIDFETADPDPASACAVALVQIRNGVVIRRGCSLIRPLRDSGFRFENLHGISRAATLAAPEASETGAWIEAWSSTADFFAAHNARFDAAVLSTLYRSSTRPWLCTVDLARTVWGFYPTTLDRVCARLGIQLDHHDPLSDATACAHIVMRALATRPRMNLERHFVSVGAP